MLWICCIVIGSPPDNQLTFVYCDQEKLMHFPTWIDLKGQDSVPDTVHHVVSRTYIYLINLTTMYLIDWPSQLWRL